MKRVIAALLVISVVGVVAILHIHKAKSLTESVIDVADRVFIEYNNKSRDGILENLDRISEIWDENHMWAHLTMSTRQIDEIEISLAQSRAYCEAEAWDNFAGEFTMFCMLIEHIEKQETFSWGELL